MNGESLTNLRKQQKLFFGLAVLAAFMGAMKIIGFFAVGGLPLWVEFALSVFWLAYGISSTVKIRKMETVHDGDRHFAMESSDSSVPKMLFSAQPSDIKMWQASRVSGISPSCICVQQKDRSKLGFHPEVQDTNCEAWKMLNELIDAAASRNSEEFSPGLEMPPKMWSQIVTLPPSISKLKSVKKLYLYGSFLVRVPPEIGEMTALEVLDLYTSYCLHWLPYEVTRCRSLTRSRFSTRALYGNYKFRPPFPQLNQGAPAPNTITNTCSVCGKSITPESTTQAWISLRVATDILPLLVNACSDECINRLPAPAFGYVDHPHSGGLELAQPPASFVRPRA